LVFAITALIMGSIAIFYHPVDTDVALMSENDAPDEEASEEEALTSS
jgi:hypothetical protein